MTKYFAILEDMPPPLPFPTYKSSSANPSPPAEVDAATREKAAAAELERFAAAAAAAAAARKKKAAAIVELARRGIRVAPPYERTAGGFHGKIAASASTNLRRRAAHVDIRRP